MSPAAKAFFLPVQDGQRYCVHHAPAGAPGGLVLFVHAWAEEMNKSRRMAALAARALAASGCAVLQLDLGGCGDSSGEFGDHGWAGWVQDVAEGAHWLRGQYPNAPHAPLVLWGQRAGALLAVQAAPHLHGEQPLFLFWQPAPAGKPLLQQFLRLKAAAGMQQRDPKTTLDEARAALAAGQAVDVAGYSVPAALAAGLEAASLEPPARAAHVAWLEVSTRAPVAVLPASASCIDRWRAAGHAVDVQVVKGPAFWQTQEIEDAPDLVGATVQAALALLARSERAAQGPDGASDRAPVDRVAA